MPVTDVPVRCQTAQAANVAFAAHRAALGCAGCLGVKYVTLRADSARAAAGRGRSAQAAWTNCICVPASSITSPFFSPTVSPMSGLLLTVGREAPSTWASTYPVGRLVIEATWTPGLPTVVTTLVSMTSRPAAAPFMTRIVAGPTGAGAPARPAKPEARPLDV